MKLKRNSLFILVIIIMIINVSLFNSCKGKNSGNQSLHENDQTSELNSIHLSTYYENILNRDLSDFAGVWINGSGDRRQLTANGLFFSESPEGQRAGDFARIINFDNIEYSWINETEPDEEGISFGFIVTLYPAGQNILINGNIMQSDATRDRIIAYAHESPSPLDSHIVYYRQKTKLLHYISSESAPEGAGGNSITYEYDNFNRIIKTIHNRQDVQFTRTITYSGNSVIIETKPPSDDEEDQFVDRYVDYKRSGISITYSYGNMEAAMELNYDGTIRINKADFYRAGEVHVYDFEYLYSNAVSKSETIMYDEEINRIISSTYRYDNQKSPHYCDFTPKWLLQEIYDVTGLVNNVIHESNNLTDLEFLYEYDFDGYPVKRIMINNHGGETYYETTNYYYYGELAG